jgi:hypothetical protein
MMAPVAVAEASLEMPYNAGAKAEKAPVAVAPVAFAPAELRKPE